MLNDPTKGWRRLPFADLVHPEVEVWVHVNGAEVVRWAGRDTWDVYDLARTEKPARGGVTSLFDALLIGASLQNAAASRS